MNRILKRPMFRMGGRSDDGIMSIRRGYQEGDQVLPANTDEYRSQVEKEIFPSNLKSKAVVISFVILSCCTVDERTLLCNNSFS